MNAPKTLLRVMHEISPESRTLLVVSSAIIGLIAYGVTYPASYSGGMLSVPVIFAAWLFKQRGMLICVGSLVLILIMVYAVDFQSPPWSWPALIPCLILAAELLLMGYLISVLRGFWDEAEAAHMELNVRYEEQKQTNEMKDTFILNVNHEIRTPLTAIYGYLELLLAYNGQIDDQMQETFLRNAMYSCEELQLLINNAMDSIKVSSGKGTVKLEELAVLDVAREVVEHFDPRGRQEHPIQIEIPEYLTVRANGQYLRQILRNLLSNASKYSQPETAIRITATLYGRVVERRHPAPEVCICVKDEGLGVPPDEVSRLFAPFARLERETTTKVRGTGLGLYVCKQLVEAMGGRIWIESTGVAGEGSSFCFTLPCIVRSVKDKNIDDLFAVEEQSPVTEPQRIALQKGEPEKEKASEIKETGLQGMPNEL